MPGCGGAKLHSARVSIASRERCRVLCSVFDLSARAFSTHISTAATPAMYTPQSLRLVGGARSSISWTLYPAFSLNVFAEYSRRSNKLTCQIVPYDLTTPVLLLVKGASRMSGTFRFLRVACVMLTMPALCACFSPSMLPGATACTGLAAARAAPSSLRHRQQALVLRAGLGDGDGATEDAKEAALRRLAGADAPKIAPKKVAQKEAPLPEWAFFVLPIFGAACAFAFQVSVCDVESSGYPHMCAGARGYVCGCIAEVLTVHTRARSTSPRHRCRWAKVKGVRERASRTTGRLLGK